jgi:hypothetical protein
MTEMLWKLMNLTIVSALTILIGSVGYATEPSSTSKQETVQNENEQSKENADQTHRNPDASKQEKKSTKESTVAEKAERVIQDLTIEPYFIPAM